MLKLPRFVQGFVDRHGRARYYFRRPGFDRVSLPGAPWSPEFMTANENASKVEKPKQQIGSDKVRPWSMRALALKYYDSATYKALESRSPGTSTATSSIASAARSTRTVSRTATRALSLSKQSTSKR